MDEIVYNAINTTLNSFDFSFCIVVNILTYSIIKVLDEVNGDKKVPTWTKRGVLLCSIVFIGLIYSAFGSDNKLIINSSILAPVFWSWIAKPIMKKLNIDYKQD